MRDLEFWQDYYRGRTDYRSIRFFWLSYFESFGFRKSSRKPYNSHDSLSWYYREGLYVGYYCGDVDGETIMWELWFKDVFVPVSTSGFDRIRKEKSYFRSVPEVLWVLDCLRDPFCLPLLLGIKWVAPLVPVLLKEQPYE